MVDWKKNRGIGNRQRTDAAISEIRYTCHSCGNVWHKLPASESKTAKGCTGALAGLSCISAPCCFPFYAALFGGTQEDRMCPKCHSQNIKREVLKYDKEGHPKE